MQEVIRLKKLEERREIDRQVNRGLLLIGSPDIKKNKLNQLNGERSGRNELSDIANNLTSNRSSNKGGSILRSSQDGDHSSSSPSRYYTKLK